MARVQYMLLLLLLPLALKCVPLQPVTDLEGQIASAVKQRQLETKFSDMTAFFSERLDASAGSKSFSDKTGNCRLSWYDWMMRHPVESIGAADEFTRGLHKAALLKTGAVPGVLSIARTKLDARLSTEALPLPAVKGIADAGLRTLVATLLAAHREFSAALAPLNLEEQEEVRANLYQQSTGSKAIAPFFADQAAGRRVCNLLEKMDRSALIRAGEYLARLSEPSFLKQIMRTASRQAGKNTMVRINTPAGEIIFGGRDNNEYRLDDPGDVVAVVDAGGDDTYLDGSLSSRRSELVVIDLAGNDTYSGEKPGIQGGAILGTSLLIDAMGNDNYRAGDVAQGACLAGTGILIDMAGNDRYTGLRRVQGSAICGIALLLDRAGDDDYRTSLLGQGVGGPLGFGLLDDLDGKDHYYAGGKEMNTYGDTPGYDGWSQGAGVGPRGVANGGIGCLLDGGGDDIYEADYFSHAAGYWFALGFARDFGGNDQRVGSTRTAYDGGERKEARFLRWGNGFGCHYAAGYLFDDSGDDTYLGDHACVNFNWDIGITALVDLAGNDQYKTTSSGVGLCSNCGLSVLFDGGGDDSYNGPGLGSADATTPYHNDPRAYNFAFLIDASGNDRYPNDIANGAEYERGWKGGFLIDRK